MDGHDTEICVIGAGMAGLACATALMQAGRAVRVIDKGRGPGGRMAARRAEIAGETVSFDHGAQYFTARDEGFKTMVSDWIETGVVAPWPAAGEDCFVGVPGMNGPIRAMAQNCDVDWGVRATSLSRASGRWVVETDQGAIRADHVLAAIPVEQARELIAEAAPDLSSILAKVASEPCWTAMAAFADRLDLPDVVRGDEGQDPIAWAARNSGKPQRRGTECWVIQASHTRSREIIDLSKDEAGPKLVDDFFKQTGGAAQTPMHLAAHRWLYSKPDAVEGDAARYDAEACIGIAGDYLHSPRVEGAWISGRTLAQKVVSAV